MMTAARLTVVSTLILACAACGSGSKETARAPAPVEVGVVTVQPEDVTLTTELPGRTSPFLVAEVRPQVGGLLLRRQFEEGSEVRQGELLYQIDPSTYQATLARTEASLEAARLLDDRYGKLIQSRAVSQQDRDNARARYLEARAAHDAARIDLNRTRITAPISGRIGRSSVTQGALLTANQPQSLATVQKLNPIYVDITQPSSAILALKADLAEGHLKRAGNGAAAEVRLTLENGSMYPLPGTLKFSEVSVDQSTGAVTLRAVFPNPDGTLMPGMFVRALLQEGVRSQALLVPQRGVTRDGAGQALALVLDRDNRVEVRPIGAERTLGDRWIVSSGLTAGDRVIVDGVQRVQPGVQVTPVTAESVSAAPLESAK